MINFLKYIGLGAFSAAWVISCVSVKKNKLYEEVFNPNDTLFYTSSEIYTDYITSEGWITEDPNCIIANITKEAAYQGNLGIDLTWNKTKEGCPWLGFGFGWDNWTGKDLTRIKNIAAIQFHVRMVEGERKNLPWAIGLEDFTGAQAWLGMSPNAIKAEKITTEWTRVELPISEFNWEEQDADPSNIKQIIFNTEADGRVFIDEIKIVPYSGGFRNRANLNSLSKSNFKADGIRNDDLWKTNPITFEQNRLYIGIDGEFLCLGLIVKDDTPLQNSFKNEDIYKGDALELAFSTDPTANTRRTRYLSTDQHIGIGFNGMEITTWNWQSEKAFEVASYAIQNTDTGYIFEAKIKFSELNADAFVNNTLYGLEVAVDQGNLNGRINQQRWNDPVNNGFYNNPSLWGELFLSIDKSNQ